jgi:hypothetical protein
MECADAGFDTWFFFALTTAMVGAFVVRARQTQRWLREHPRAAEGFGLMLGLKRLLEERYLWAFRLLFGPIPSLMWAVSLIGLYCFFHGADYPPLSR